MHLTAQAHSELLAKPFEIFSVSNKDNSNQIHFSRGHCLLVQINMYTNTHGEDTNNPLRGPFAQKGPLWVEASKCALSNILIRNCMFPLPYVMQLSNHTRREKVCSPYLCPFICCSIEGLWLAGTYQYVYQHPRWGYKQSPKGPFFPARGLCGGKRVSVCGQESWFTLACFHCR